MLGGGLGCDRDPDRPPEARLHFWDTGRGLHGLRDPRAKWGGGSFLHVLGPKAEGAELKIAGGSGSHLRWPSSPRPRGQLLHPAPCLGHFWDTFPFTSSPREFQDIATPPTPPSLELGEGRG